MKLPQLKSKTGKREMAIAISLAFAWLVYKTVSYIIASDSQLSVTKAEQLIGLVGILIYPVLMFVSSVYGMDYVAKQWKGVSSFMGKNTTLKLETDQRVDQVEGK